MISKEETHIKLRAGSSLVKIRPAFSFDSKNVMVAAGNDIKVINIASGECVRFLTGHPSPVIGLQTNPNNHTQLISCSRDGTIIKWDYLDGVALKKFELQDGEFAAFYAPAKGKPLYAIQLEKPNVYDLRSFSSTGQGNKAKTIIKDVDPYEHSVAFGAQGTLVASIKAIALTVFDLHTGIWKCHMNQTNLVCVACHPGENTVATGDETGRIVVWNNLFSLANLSRSIYHWHTLPVGDLCFSIEGVYLYSGGGECVLVKWNLHRESREFIPRIGLPICQIAVSPNSSYIAVCHVDNGMSLVSPQLQVVQYIQGLSQCHHWSSPGQLAASTGLLYDPRSRCLVLTGRPGHLQFFSLLHDKQLYSLDVVGQNFLTQERDHIVYNTQVEKAALDSAGLWLATIQVFDDKRFSPDIVLKVWKYAESNQNYTLNTTVLLPHYQKVNSIAFRPNKAGEVPLFVTTSEDTKFKTWALESNNEGAKTSESWVCESLGHYRNYVPSDLSFHEDGSILAVAFHWTITLWEPSPLVLKTTLSHPSCRSHIRQLFFGRSSCKKYLVARSDQSLNVWDSVEQKPQWLAELNPIQLASDPLSEYMATFGSDNTLYIFKPCNPKPCFIKQSISKTEIITAAFIPQQIKKENSESFLDWQKESQLYFMNKDQELLTVVSGLEQTDDDPKTIPENEQIADDKISMPSAGYSALIAQQKTSGIESMDYSLHHSSSGLLGAKEIKELLEIPSHVMPHLHTLCSHFMSALLIPREI